MKFAVFNHMLNFFIVDPIIIKNMSIISTTPLQSTFLLRQKILLSPVGLITIIRAVKKEQSPFAWALV